MSTDAQRKGANDLRMSRRGFLRVAAVTAGAAVLAACGGSSGTPAAGSAEAPAAAGGVVEISQWYHQYGEEGTQKAAQRYADEYSKVNPKAIGELPPLSVSGKTLNVGLAPMSIVRVDVQL